MLVTLILLRLFTLSQQVCEWAEEMRSWWKVKKRAAILVGYLDSEWLSVCSHKPEKMCRAGKYWCAVRAGRHNRCKVLSWHRNNPVQSAGGKQFWKEKKTIWICCYRWDIPKQTCSSCWEIEVKLFWCVNRSVLCFAYDWILHCKGEGEHCISNSFKSDASQLERDWRRAVRMIQRSRKYDLWRNDQKSYICLV